AVQTLKERMRALDAGDHNLTELGPETTIPALRMAADAVPFLAERRMVIVRGLLGRFAGRGRRPTRARKSSDSTADEFQSLVDYLPDVPQSTSLAFVEDASSIPAAFVSAIPRGRGAVREYPRVNDVTDWVRKRARLIGADLDE